MWAILAAGVDFVHALLMAAWVGGLWLLFCHRWPRLTRAYGVYAVAFIGVSQTSHWLLGECVFTTIARFCLRVSSAPVSDEWFTVRVAQAVFHMAPSHRAVVWASESLILVTALGAIASHKVWDRQRLRPHTDRVQA
jgi:hypothetical protein